MKFNEFIDDYYIDSIQGLEQTTQDGYMSSINKYIRPIFGEMEMENLTALQIQEWLNDFEKPGAAEKAYKCLRQIIRRAIDYEIYNGEDPTKKHVVLPKKKPYSPKLLNGTQIGELLEAFKGHYLEPTIICAATLGLRRGEAFGIHWEDIDLKTGAVRINKSYQKIRGVPQYRPTKTVRSCRTCYLPQETLPRMRELGERKTGRICSEKDPDVMAADYQKWCQIKRIEYTPFTNLRHSWATIALESGTDISIVSNMLGHSDINTAYNHYLKPRENMYKQTQAGVSKLTSLGKVFGKENRRNKWESWTKMVKSLLRKK